jgi:hypothetical protein
MFDPKRGDLYATSVCRKGQKQGKNIPVRFDGLIAATL